MPFTVRTLATQVKLRRLIRSFAEPYARLEVEPGDRRLVGALVDRPMELAGDVQEAWRQESRLGRLEPVLAAYLAEAMRTRELAIVGLRQAGSDVELLRAHFEAAALPPATCVRALDAEPGPPRSARLQNPA